MSKSNYLENVVLDYIFGNATFAATLYVGLFTAAPNDAGGGTEVTGNAYTRASVTNDTTNWPAASGGSKSNGAAINFPTPTGSWGTITHFGIFDAATNGNLLYWGSTTPVAAGVGNNVGFATGQLTITED